MSLFEKKYVNKVFTLHSASSRLKYLICKSFKKLLNSMEHSKEIILTGPKGVGKSFSLLALLAMRSKPTVLLSVDSLKYSRSTITYLKGIMTTFWKGECYIQ